MTKLVLSDTSGGYDISTINDNFQAISDELQNKVLYRDNTVGEANNMNNNLDMNGYRILNCPSLGDGSGGGGGGGTGVDGFSSALVYAYQRKATAPTGSPGAVTYTFSTKTITVPSGPALANGWTKTIPEGDQPLYVTIATASNQAIDDFIDANEWATPVILVKDGVSALNTAAIYAYQRTPTNVAPANPSQQTTYFFGSGALVGLNNGWTSTIPPSFNGKYLWVITATAVSLTGTDLINAAEWAEGKLLAQDGLDGINGGSNGLSNASFYAYKRAVVAPTDNPGDVTYHFPSASITTPSTDALANGWFKTPPTGPNALYTVVASASGSGVTDTVSAAEWTTPTLIGSNGISVATVYIYQRTNTSTAPPLPNATVTYNFGTSFISGLSNGWSATIPVSTGAFLWVTTATAAGTGTDTIPSSEWAAAQQLAKNGTDGLNGAAGGSGPAGQRGTVSISAATGQTFWNDTLAASAISFAGYGVPQNRDIVTLYNNNSTPKFVQTRFYDNGSWLLLDSFIDGNLLVSGTVSAGKVSGGILSGIQIQVGGPSIGGLAHAFEVSTSGVVYASNINSGQIFGDNAGSSFGSAITGNGRVSGNYGVLGVGWTGTGAGGVRGFCQSNNTSGQVGSTLGYDFYADGAGINYGPFTGAHDALLTGENMPEFGDILVDKVCVSRSGLSNTIFEVEPSNSMNDKRAVGVFVQAQEFRDDFVPAAFKNGEGTLPNLEAARKKYLLAGMNALGEGQINVCGINGNIEAGDYIVTSSIKGKGMKQDDNIQRSYTVARARESVTFSKSSEVKQVACIYLCG